MAKRPPAALLAVLGLALALWAAVCLPTLAGRRTFFLRDVFTTHLPYKAFGARELAAGRIPAVNPAWGLGQPFRGNPNALPYYPDNLLYLVLPFWSAFNAHYALHWLLALFTMGLLARRLGASREAALLAGVTYAGSGWMLSALSFYNLLTVAAWWPLVLYGAVRGDRRGLALGGLACGLALLGGEPVAAALGLVPLVLVAVSAHGPRRGAATALALGALGAVVALPQIVALLRVLPTTVRGGLGMSAAQAADYTLHPARLLELVVPFPFGRPTWIGPAGVWAVQVLPAVPLFLTLYAGIVGLWLAAVGAAIPGGDAGERRSRRAWAALAAGSLAFAILAGGWGPALARLSFGLFRFPEKFLFGFALALPLLAAWGLDAVATSRGARRLATAAGALGLAAAALLRLATPSLLAGAAPRLAGQPAAQALLGTQLAAWTLALAVGGAALALAAWSAGSGRPALVIALEIACLVQLYPLVATDRTAPYVQPAVWAARAGAVRGTPLAALDELTVSPHWRAEPAYAFPPGPHWPAERVKAADLGAAPGVLHGLTYPLAPDLEGMQTIPLHDLLGPLRHRPWAERALWMRLTGVQAAVLFEDPAVADLTLLDRATRQGVESRLYAVRDPAPTAWWPRRVVVAGPTGSAAARDAVVAASDALGTAVVPRPVVQGTGRVRVVAETADRIDLDVAGTGGVVVVRRAYLPLYQAEAEGRKLPSFAADLALLGVEVPPGRHQVRIAIAGWPEGIASGLALLGVLGMVILASRAPKEPRGRGLS